MLALTEAVRHIGVDVDLAQDVVAAPDQHDQLRFGERVAREIIPPPHRIHVRDILIRHCPRLPSRVVALGSTLVRRLLITTVSPGRWLRRASVMSDRLPMCLSPMAVITSPPARPACSAGLPARAPVMRAPSEAPPPLLS